MNQEKILELMKMQLEYYQENEAHYSNKSDYINALKNQHMADALKHMIIVIGTEAK